MKTEINDPQSAVFVIFSALLHLAEAWRDVQAPTGSSFRRTSGGKSPLKASVPIRLSFPAAAGFNPPTSTPPVDVLQVPPHYTTRLELVLLYFMWIFRKRTLKKNNNPDLRRLLWVWDGFSQSCQDTTPNYCWFHHQAAVLSGMLFIVALIYLEM